MAVRRAKVTTAPAVGPNGSAVGIGVTEIAIHGVVLDVHYKRDVGPVSSTNTVLREHYNDPSKEVHRVTGLNADGWHPVRTTLVDQNDNPLVGPVDYQNVTDHLELRIEGANTGSVVTATIEWDDERIRVQ